MEMNLLNLKVTYEWYTPGGRRRQFYDFANGVTLKVCIDNIKKIIKKRIRHEYYKVLNMEFSTK